MLISCLVIFNSSMLFLDDSEIVIKRELRYTKGIAPFSRNEANMASGRINDVLNTSSADSPHPVYRGVRAMLSVVGRENRNRVSVRNPALCDFVDINFSPSSVNIFNIPPIKNQDSFLTRQRACKFRDRPENSRDIPNISSDAFEGGAEKLRGQYGREIDKIQGGNRPDKVSDRRMRQSNS